MGCVAVVWTVWAVVCSLRCMLCRLLYGPCRLVWAVWAVIWAVWEGNEALRNTLSLAPHPDSVLASVLTLKA